MHTIEMDHRRYRRMHARVPVTLVGGEPHVELTTLTVDVSTGGGSFDLLQEEMSLQVGDTVEVEVLLRDGTRTFTTSGTVRNLRSIPGDMHHPPALRVGVQFREALLLSELPQADE